ncbi:MAG TPA: hypothetical protein VIA06_17835 [Candidatus Dormibacteraeota bacterium]|jgi:hypothetical protein|nr:hypothetical protein [Candidatus Dormibacteraeota bacterium]
MQALGAFIGLFLVAGLAVKGPRAQRALVIVGSGVILALWYWRLGK